MKLYSILFSLFKQLDCENVLTFCFFGIWPVNNDLRSEQIWNLLLSHLFILDLKESIPTMSIFCSRGIDFYFHSRYPVNLAELNPRWNNNRYWILWIAQNGTEKDRTFSVPIFSSFKFQLTCQRYAVKELNQVSASAK